MLACRGLLAALLAAAASALAQSLTPGKISPEKRDLRRRLLPASDPAARFRRGTEA
ncbi:hypothetical protein LRS73_27075 [Methylobacterium currus]|uniref:hypothetical protein n=1 Tax=Methylobacterium currus TaxID=2051553 RepID=UPI001E345574|nr:hypothetical protein [Methylobacterium currus]UHC19194.1 hypothetical protein LRS73_27075 [Methylobacterium currus]